MLYVFAMATDQGRILEQAGSDIENWLQFIGLYDFKQTFQMTSFSPDFPRYTPLTVIDFVIFFRKCIHTVCVVCLCMYA